VNTYGKALKEWGHGKRKRTHNALFRAANKARWWARTGGGATANQGDAQPPAQPRHGRRTATGTDGEEA